MSNTVKDTAGLSAEEKRALLARLLREKGGAGRADDGFVHRLIHAQAERTPAAVAVSFGEKTLTYRELDERSNRLARHLRGLGVGPESLVGLCTERSPEMIVGLLGILKAGAAYVPLDPAYPPDRLAFMLDDSRLAVLLTQEVLRERLPDNSATVVFLDSDWPSVAPEGTKGVVVSGENLAYVIYTSGSTGKPKGVQVPHRALANFLKSMRNLLGIAAGDALLAVTTLSFDIAGLELFLPLTVGARVELAGREEAADGARLIERLERSGVTFLQATPATWRLLLESGWQGTPGLTMLCGGEALPRELADRLVGRGKALWNVYGPTETTIWSSAGVVEPGEGPVPVGRPIAKTQLYVLDGYLRPVPVGVTGELYIGGAGLARGYLDRPGLTAERFIPDPLGREAGGRLYRTGDLARWRSDGGLECLGRVDHQVKIRGFRVELGEVESALLRHPAVRDAVVTARDDSSGEMSLVGYLVPREGQSPNAADLRRTLAETLPEYMVPTTYVSLDELPRTPNGKVDRKALPDPEQAALVSEGGYTPPRGPVEEALVGIWGEILGRERIGVFDNFFESGGHSLFATQLFARLRDTFGVEPPPLQEFFETATVAWLARRIEDALRAERGLASPPIVPVGRDRPLPASFAQQRLWFLDQLEPGSASYNIPTAVRLSGTLDVAALETALNEVVRRHEVLRTTFAAKDGQPWQTIAPSLTIPLPVSDLSALPDGEREAEAARLTEEESRRPFDLAAGPLIRARLLRLGDQEHVVLVNMHHIISDGWSMGILVRDVGELYLASTRRVSSPLPELPLQYADFSVWQREWLRGDVLQAQLDYWKHELAGVPVLEVPTDSPRPPAMSLRGAVRSVEIPKALIAELRGLSRQEGATVFMALLGAFQTLLHRYSGQEDVVVGTPIAGRTRSEIENLVGFFVNTLVLRGDLSGDPSFRELLRRVRRASLGAYAHQDLPFEQLVGVLHPERDPSRTPIFQVMFAMQDAPLPSLSTPELSMAVLDTDSGTAKFDLTLLASETEGGLQLRLEYSTDLFEEATVDRMLGHLRTLFESILADPDQPVATLPMLTEAERNQLLGRSDGDADAVGDPEHRNGEAQPDLDQLSDDELDALLTRFESEHDAEDD
jgi:amino acid adenylation domain-containing protein